MVTFLRGLAGVAPSGECELCRTNDGTLLPAVGRPLAGREVLLPARSSGAIDAADEVVEVEREARFLDRPRNGSAIWVAALGEVILPLSRRCVVDRG